MSVCGGCVRSSVLIATGRAPIMVFLSIFVVRWATFPAPDFPLDFPKMPSVVSLVWNWCKTCVGRIENIGKSP